MAIKYSRKDIKELGGDTYQLGSLEFEIVSGTLGYKNLDTEEVGTSNVEDLRAEFGDEVASFFNEKLGH
jgi:hypothetical protein